MRPFPPIPILRFATLPLALFLFLSTRAIYAGAPAAANSPARQAMLDALLGNAERLHAAAQSSPAPEFTRTNPPSRLSRDNTTSPSLDAQYALIRLMDAWQTPDPARRKQLLQELSLQPPGETARREAALALADDPAARVRRLRGQDLYNRATHPVNLCGSILFAALTLDFQRMGTAGAELFFLDEPLREITTRDRAIHALCLRHPELRTTEPDIARTDDAIAARLEKLHHRESLRRAEWHLKNNRFEEARECAKEALAHAPNDSEAQNILLRASQAASALKRARLQPPPLRPNAPALNLADLRATPGRITPLKPDDLDIKRSELRRAEERQAKDQAQYILWGRKDAAGTFQPESSSSQAHTIFSAINILLPLQWGVRKISTVWGHPIPDDDWRETAARLLRETVPGIPDSTGTTITLGNAAPLDPESEKLALRLANSYLKNDRFNEARAWHIAAKRAEDPDWAAELDKKAARRLLDALPKQETTPQKKQLLQTIIDRYPATASAGKARRELDKINKQPPDNFQIAKNELAELPEIWLEQGLRLPPAWFDGKTANGELEKDGLHFRENGAIIYTLRTPGGTEEKSIAPGTIPAGEIEKIRAIWKRQTAANERENEENPGFLFPLEIQGSAGIDGVNAIPQLLPLPPSEQDKQLYGPAGNIQR